MTKRAFIWLFVALLLLPLAHVPIASAAGEAVQTDKADYEPGETVTINGSGFLPWVAINLKALKDSSIFAVVGGAVQAGGSGDFLATFPISTDWLFATCTLQAVPSFSGSASTAFSIITARGQLTISFSLQGAATTHTATFAFTFYEHGGTSPLFSRTVTIPALAGSFILAGVTAGSYDIKRKEGRALSALRTGVVIGTGTVR